MVMGGCTAKLNKSIKTNIIKIPISRRGCRYFSAMTSIRNIHTNDVSELPPYVRCLIQSNRFFRHI